MYPSNIQHSKPSSGSIPKHSNVQLRTFGKVCLEGPAFGNPDGGIAP